MALADGEPVNSAYERAQRDINVFSVLFLFKGRGLRDLHVLCVYPSIIFRMPEQVFMKLGTYNTEREPISRAYLINPSLDD
jgi:hypothetical protein